MWVGRVLAVAFGAALCFLLVLGLAWLADEGLGGALKQWFYDSFIYPVYERSGLSYSAYDTFFDWQRLRQYAAVALAAAVLALAAGCALASHFYARRRTRRQARTIEEYVDRLLDEAQKAPPALPEALSGVEARLVRMRSGALSAQRQAEREVQRKNDLVAYLAHDLKTPLASVIGYLSLLSEAEDLPAAQRVKYTDIALQKANRLEQLIDEFFEIVRFDAQGLALEEGRINFQRMMLQMADEFYPMLMPGDKTIEVRVGEDVTVWGDADKLARVFNNILKNALAYSYDHTAIEVDAREEAGRVIATVLNRGDPIPRRKLDAIFEKFYRLDGARSTRSGGAGLGLAIAKEIVLAHGGEISADSDAERTVFTVVLPGAAAPGGE